MSVLTSTRRLVALKCRPAAAILRTALAPDPRLQRRIAIPLAVVLVLGGLYMLWLRDSGLVAVDRVEVTGASGRDADRVRAALDNAARGMTTLHVDHEALESAVEVFPVVQAIRVETDFPSGMRIEVIQHSPVAILVAEDARIPVAGDGSVLAGIPTEGSLPEIRTEAAIPDRRLDPGTALDSVRVAAGAPDVLIDRLERVERAGERGLVVSVRDGPELVFGGADRIEAKWAAALRVLADPDAGGAEYLDVRIPERPAAGGLAVQTVAPVAPAGQAAEAPPPVPGASPDAAADPAAAVAEGEPDAAVDPSDAVPDATPAPAPVEPAPIAETPAGETPVGAGGGAVADPQP